MDAGITAAIIGGVIGAVASILVGVIGVVAVIYSGRFGRFISEKHWEQKADAYIRIISALSDLVDYHEQYEAHESAAQELSEEKERELNELWKQAEREVTKATNIGVFLISAEAVASLEHFRKVNRENYHPEDWYGDVERGYRYAKDCLEELISCAKKDLGFREKGRPSKKIRQSEGGRVK